MDEPNNGLLIPASQDITSRLVMTATRWCCSAHAEETTQLTSGKMLRMQNASKTICMDA
jgi:hypothetical protein